MIRGTLKPERLELWCILMFGGAYRE